uniref:Uncharacterized protein n=1 Tax=Kalanchoe fedtschenkoi TaxID=63787 RepID=A0A7N0U5X5_KALFE
MAETTPDIEKTSPARAPNTDQPTAESSPSQTLDVLEHDPGVKLALAREAYKAYGDLEDKPRRGEVLGWCLYEFCSYFIHTVLLPIVFPLIISQAVADPHKLLTATAAALADTRALAVSDMGFQCKHRQMQLYQGLTNQTIGGSQLSLSPLEFTSVSWSLGLILAVPILAILSRPLDRSPHHRLITLGSIALGALCCLPVGFFQTTWIFPPYIAVIVAASITASSGHTRHLSLMLRGYTAPTIHPDRFPLRSTISGWLSLHSAAAGSVGAALIAAFTYHMLRNSEKFISLWIVCIFSGLIWAAGISHIFLGVSRGRSGAGGDFTFAPSLTSHIFDVFLRPYSAVNLCSVLFSSFSTACIFTAAVLHLVGQICIKPLDLLFLWLTYFLFPLLSLPLSHPFQHFLKADAAKMQILGFLISAFTSGYAFFYRAANWNKNHVLLFAGVQSTAAGLLHAFGRSLMLDCAPIGKEWAHSMWHSWVRAVGMCAGFAMASSAQGNISRPFGISFWVSVVGIVVVIFGNVSGLHGGLSAGNVNVEKEEEEPSLVRDFDAGEHEVDTRSGVHMEMP